MKPNNWCFLILTVLFVACLSACTQKVESNDPVDLGAAKQEATKVVNQFAEFWQTENMDLLSEIMAHDADMVNFGSDVSEHFVGYDNFRSVAEQMMPMLDSTTITIREQVVNVDSTGTLAWFSEFWDWKLKMQGQPVEIPGQRLTGVLQKRNGKWVIVQFHNSVPVMPG